MNENDSGPELHPDPPQGSTERQRPALLAQAPELLELLAEGLREDDGKRNGTVDECPRAYGNEPHGAIGLLSLPEVSFCRLIA